MRKRRKKIQHKTRRKVENLDYESINSINEAIDEGLIALSILKRHYDMAEVEIKKLRADVVKNMRLLNRDVHKVIDNNTGVLIKARRIIPERPVLHENELRKRINARQLVSITSQVIDKAKLEDAITKGFIDRNIISDCTEMIKGTEYVRIDVK